MSLRILPMWKPHIYNRASQKLGSGVPNKKKICVFKQLILISLLLLSRYSRVRLCVTP